MKRFFFLCCAVLSVVLFSQFSANVNAASPWDSTVNPTESLLMRFSDGSGTVDITSNWLETLNTMCSSEIYDSFISAGDAFPDGRIAILQMTPSSPSNYRAVAVVWSENDPLPTVENQGPPTWSDYVFWMSGPSNSVKYVLLGPNNTESAMACSPAIQSSSGFMIAGDTGAEIYQPYFSQFDVEYPPDYEGTNIPSSIADETGFVPQYSWTVDTEGVLRAPFLKNNATPLSGYGNYRLFEADSSWTPGTMLDQKVERPFDTYSYEYDALPGEGYYSLVITYEEGDWQVAPDGFDYVETVVFRIYWDGHSFIQGGNSEGCTDNICNNLEQENPIIRALRSINIETHGLQAFLLAPINFLSSLPQYVDNCAPISIPIIGTTQTFQCLSPVYEAWSPAVNAIWHTVLIAITGYWLGVRLFKLVKDINTPQKDGIELGHL